MAATGSTPPSKERLVTSVPSITKRSYTSAGFPIRSGKELGGGWTLRFGPFRAVDVAAALSAFVY
jgi:hypothetical protein